MKHYTYTTENFNYDVFTQVDDYAVNPWSYTYWYTGFVNGKTYSYSNSEIIKTLADFRKNFSKLFGVKPHKGETIEDAAERKGFTLLPIWESQYSSEYTFYAGKDNPYSDGTLVGYIWSNTYIKDQLNEYTKLLNSWLNHKLYMVRIINNKTGDRNYFDDELLEEDNALEILLRYHFGYGILNEVK